MAKGVVITGSAGYIGRWLIPELKTKGYRVVGIDRQLSQHDPGLDEFIRMDFNDENRLETVLKSAKIVFHLAASKDDFGISDAQYFRDNVEATRSLIRAGKNCGIKHWVFYSTVGVMGPSTVPINERAAFAPTNAYGASKAEAEKLFHQLVQDDEQNQVLIIRPSVVYGIDNYPTTNIYRLIDAIYRNRFIMIGDGLVHKSTSYIENLIDATLFLFERMCPGLQTYIYVDEPVLQTVELVQKIYEFLHMPPQQWRLPLWLAKCLASAFDFAGTVSGVNFDITANRIEKFCTATNFDASAIRQLGFRQPVSNEEALKKTIHWHLHTQVPKSYPANDFHRD
jgi:nucleoside-diphosphate-sugar epimerase